jgi:chemotaxis protein MotA
MKKNRTVDLGTVGGLVLGVASIFGGFMLEGGQFGALILLPAMLTVFGGTFAATIIGTSTKNIGTMFKLIGRTIVSPKYDIKGVIQDTVQYASIARKEGLLMLDNQIDKMRDPFMQRIVRHAIDGAEPDVLKELSDAELDSLADRHVYGASLFQKMGGYSPTMGIIGTVMGLITTLASAGDNPDILIRHIASAFIATLWGIFMANIVWLPISEKLKYLHEEENRYKEIIVAGVMAIQAGEIPSVIRAKLNGQLPPDMQEVE